MMIEYIYPDPPASLNGFPCKIIISDQTKNGLSPEKEIVVQSIHLAARHLPADFFSESKFKTAAIIHTNIYTDGGLYVYGSDGKTYLISNQNGKTIAIPGSPFAK
jgi:hypothetical protein